MKGGSQDQPGETGNVEEREVSTNRQTQPLALFTGEAQFALVWLCDPYNQFTKPAPADRPGKK